MEIRKIKLFALILVLLYSCDTMLRQSRNGNVYVFDEKINNTSIDLNRYSIVGIRIDIEEKNKLLVKYKVGFESFLNIDFLLDKNINSYVSIGKMIINPKTSKESIIYLNFKNKNTIELSYYKEEIKVSYLYRFSYKDKVDLKTHRDPYFAEDGYRLFKNNRK